MDQTKKVIELAEQNGYRAPYDWDEDSWQGEAARLRALQDPLFWQAFGKSRGWKMNFDNTDPEWKELTYGEMMERNPKTKNHQYIDHIWEGKSPESFFSDLV